MSGSDEYKINRAMGILEQLNEAELGYDKFLTQAYADQVEHYREKLAQYPEHIVEEARRRAQAQPYPGQPATTDDEPRPKKARSSNPLIALLQWLLGD
jgi:hypothetical protein